MRVNTEFVNAQMPREMLAFSPRIALLLNRYYDWEYRNGLSPGEVRSYRLKEASLTGTTYSPLENSELVNRHENYVQPGVWHRYFHENMTIERDFVGFETADGDTFVENHGYFWDTTLDVNRGIELWSARMNHEPSNNLASLSNIDEPRFLRLLKHLYASKGTNYVLQLLFNIHFGEDVEFYNPKLDLAKIDNNLICDGANSIMRDDVVYQEYSMVIKVKGDLAKYQEILDRVYYPNFHPGGFKLTLVQE